MNAFESTSGSGSSRAQMPASGAGHGNQTSEYSAGDGSSDAQLTHTKEAGSPTISHGEYGESVNVDVRSTVTPSARGDSPDMPRTSEVDKETLTSTEQSASTSPANAVGLSAPRGGLSDASEVTEVTDTAEVTEIPHPTDAPNPADTSGVSHTSGKPDTPDSPSASNTEKPSILEQIKGFFTPPSSQSSTTELACLSEAEPTPEGDPLNDDALKNSSRMRPSRKPFSRRPRSRRVPTSFSRTFHHEGALDQGLASLQEGLGLTSTSASPYSGHDEPIIARPTAGCAATLIYAPDMDGQADPGEVVWVRGVFAGDSDNDRAVVILGHHGNRIRGLLISTKDACADDDNWMDIGAGGWDRRGRQAWVRLDKVFEIPEHMIRRKGTILPRRRFERIAARLRSDYNWH